MKGTVLPSEEEKALKQSDNREATEDIEMHQFTDQGMLLKPQVYKIQGVSKLLIVL